MFDISGDSPAGKSLHETLGDEFIGDIRLVSVCYSHLLLAVKMIADGKYSSCAHEAQYAGGVVSEGNRIFTPAEGASNVLKTVKELTEKAEPNYRTLDGTKPYSRIEEVLNVLPNVPLLDEIRTVNAQYVVALSFLEACAKGVFSSCEHELKHAGEIIDEGDRVYTPVEGATEALKRIGNLENVTEGVE